MITILTRILPYDISYYIFEIIKKENIEIECFNKRYLMIQIMENIINKYSYENYYNIIYDMTNIKQIYELHNFIIKNDIKMLSIFKNIINNYYKILKYHNNYQMDWVKKIIEKYII